MTRNMAIKWLKWIQNMFSQDSEQYKALDFAIDSLEVDEAYQLEYERVQQAKNERDSYDCISREDTKEMIRKEFPRLEERVEINSIINMMPPVNPKCNKVFAKEDLDAVVKAVQDNYFNHLKEMKSEIVRLYDKARENFRDGYVAYCDGVDDCNSVIDKYCSKENKDGTNTTNTGNN